MGNIVNIRRQLTLRAIAENPSEIILTRMVKTDDGAGGHTEEPVELPAQTFRIFLSGKSGSRDIAQEGGQMQINVMEMLCPWDADVKRGDTFVFDERNFRVHTTMPVRVQGEVVSYQCELEEVS